MTDTTVPEILPTELKARIDSDDLPVLIDVREVHEADIADLPELGQVCIPMPEFTSRIDELDRDAEMVLYCRSGSRSEWAVRVLMHEGFERVFNLKGGMLGWLNEVDPDSPAY